MRAFASVHRRAAIGLGPHFLDRRPDFFHCLSVSCDLLRLRAARASSAHLDETNVAPSVFARARHRSLAQQRARRLGSDLQPQIGFHADAEVRDRAQDPVLAGVQVSRAKIGLAVRGTGLRSLFQLFHLVRDRSSAVPVGTIPANVSRRVFLCCPFIASALVAENQLWRFPLSVSNSRVTKRVFGV
jgi:hypothetical protein